MTLKQIINMVLRLVKRKGGNLAARKGTDALARRGTPKAAPTPSARDATKRARQAARITRRTGR